MAKTTYPHVSQEFLDFMAAQEAIRIWVLHHKSTTDKPPQHLLNALEEAQKKYEQSKENANA